MLQDNGLYAANGVFSFQDHQSNDYFHARHPRDLCLPFVGSRGRACSRETNFYGYRSGCGSRLHRTSRENQGLRTRGRYYRGAPNRDCKDPGDYRALLLMGRPALSRAVEPPKAPTPECAVV